MTAKFNCRAFILGLIAAVIFLTYSESYSDVVTPVATSVAADTILENTSSILSSKIAEARDSGKEVDLAFYTTIMQSIDRLREMLRSTTKEVDVSADANLRKVSSELDSLLKRTDNITRERMTELMTISSSINQSVADLPFTPDRIMVTTVWPTLVKPRQSGDLDILILGVGLADCRSITLEINGDSYEPVTNLGNTLHFSIPNAKFDHNSTTERMVRGDLVLDTAWYKTNKHVPVAFKVLPNRYATFKLRNVIATTRIERSEPYKVNFVKFQGRDGDRSVTQKPHSAGWKIDVKSIRFNKIGGENSSDLRYSGLPTEYGFTLYSHMGVIKKGLKKEDAWATLWYEWSEFRELPDEMPDKEFNGEVTVNNEPIINRLNPNTKYITGTITDFTGKSYPIESGRSVYGFMRVDFDKASNDLIIEPDL